MRVRGSAGHGCDSVGPWSLSTELAGRSARTPDAARYREMSINRSTRSLRGARGRVRPERGIERRETQRTVDVKRGGRSGRPALFPALRGCWLVVASHGSQSEQPSLAPTAQGNGAERGSSRGGREEGGESCHSGHANPGGRQFRNRSGSRRGSLLGGASSFGGAFFSSFSWWHLFSTTLRMGESLSLLFLASVAVARSRSPRPHRGARRRALRRPRRGPHLHSQQRRVRRRRSSPRDRGRMRFGHGRDRGRITRADGECRATGGEHNGVVVLCRDGLDQTGPGRGGQSRTAGDLGPGDHGAAGCYSPRPRWPICISCIMDPPFR